MARDEAVRKRLLERSRTFITRDINLRYLELRYLKPCMCQLIKKGILHTLKKLGVVRRNNGANFIEK